MRGQRDPWGRGFGGGMAGLSRGPVATDIIFLLSTVFVTFVLQFFETTAIIPGMLRLGPLIFKGALWQLLTYAFTGFGPASLWFLLSMLILFWFARDVFGKLGRRRFWTMVLQVVFAAGVAATVVRGIGLMFGMASPYAFMLMQGQYLLVTLMIAAFATLNGNATIMLFFVLPVRARWFLPLEILFAFMGFLNSKDFAGFVGLCTAVGLTWALLESGGPRRTLDNIRLRFRRFIIEKRLARLKKKRQFDVIDGGGNDGDRWLN